MYAVKHGLVVAAPASCRASELECQQMGLIMTAFWGVLHRPWCSACTGCIADVMHPMLVAAWPWARECLACLASHPLRPTQQCTTLNKPTSHINHIACVQTGYRVNLEYLQVGLCPSSCLLDNTTYSNCSCMTRMTCCVPRFPSACSASPCCVPAAVL